MLDDKPYVLTIPADLYAELDDKTCEDLHALALVAQRRLLSSKHTGALPETPPDAEADTAFDRAVRLGGVDALSLVQRAHARKILRVLLKTATAVDAALGTSEFNRIGGQRRASRLVELHLLDLLAEF